MNDFIYDYARGLNAPYWIQEIRVKTKHGEKTIWSFSVPIQLSYFVVGIITFILMMTVFSPVMAFLYRISSISLTLYWYLPTRLAKFYSEYEPQGKKMNVFLSDYIRYFFAFVLNKKVIYQESRIDTFEELVFEPTKL